MIAGNAMRNVPPAASSQTSFQPHNGPMAATTSRRSAWLFATIRCSAPAPMSQPSRTTKTTIVKHRSANQVSTIGQRRDVGPVQKLTPDQIQIQQSEHEVEASRANEREQHRPRAHDLAESLFRSEQPIDQPRLPAKFCRHPASRVGDERKRKRQHQHPEETATGLEVSA